MHKVINNIPKQSRVLPCSEMKCEHFYVVVSPGDTTHTVGDLLYVPRVYRENIYNNLSQGTWCGDYKTHSMKGLTVKEVNVELTITGDAE